MSNENEVQAQVERQARIIARDFSELAESMELNIGMCKTPEEIEDVLGHMLYRSVPELNEHSKQRHTRLRQECQQTEEPSEVEQMGEETKQQTPDAKIINHWQGAIEAEARSIASCYSNLAEVIEKERTGVRDGDGYWHGSDAYDATVIDWLQSMGGHDNSNPLKYALERLCECDRIMADDPTLNCSEPPF